MDPGFVIADGAKLVTLLQACAAKRFMAGGSQRLDNLKLQLRFAQMLLKIGGDVDAQEVGGREIGRTKVCRMAQIAHTHNRLERAGAMKIVISQQERAGDIGTDR